ncbi:MAG: GGDEF domain-containing protein [bacterium]|jgi:diguanylate cyclase (GGDEF)-like protein
MKTETMVFAIAAFLVAFGLWEYLSIRRSLDIARGGAMKEVALSWRLIGFFLGFILLSALILVVATVRRELSIPPFFFAAFVVVASLFIAAIMALFRATLSRALDAAMQPAGGSDASGAWTDPLTGLPNRRALEHALKQEWHRSERHKRPLALIMVDLDDFGRLVDECGHDGADSYLKTFAPFLLGQLRVADTVARYDSDIFVCILPEEGPATARHVAERLRKNIAEFRAEVKGRKFGVTASIGVANNALGELSGHEELLHRADEACMAARNGGHNRVVAYTGTAKRE